jgi:simple sugar transport system ATP-binding protein
VNPPLLELHGISKHFGTVAALSDVTLRVEPDTVHALLGENGAGKTTLMSIAYGLLRPDRGTIAIGGIPRRFRSPADALDSGIGMVQQHFSLVPALTVAENIALGTHTPYRRRALYRDVAALARATGLAIDPKAQVAPLSLGAQQRVEILKALIRSARVLVFDEPTALLAPSESAELLRWIRTFCTGGRSAVLITHRLDEALSVANDITVLRNGNVVLRAKHGVTTAHLVTAMIGESTLATEVPRRVTAPAHVVARTDRLTLRDERGVYRIRDVSIEIRAGEVVGVAGVEGAGHRELLRALAGRLVPTAGTLSLPERIGYIPEDRLRDALILEYDLRANLALHGAGRRKGLVRWRHMEKLVDQIIKASDVRVAGARALAATLSGGNQQKFVFARELNNQPDLLVAINPTRGLDVRASYAIARQLRSASEAGMAVIVHSSDVDELLTLVDRILVAYAGGVREVPRDHDAIGRAMVGIG